MADAKLEELRDAWWALLKYQPNRDLYGLPKYTHTGHQLRELLGLRLALEVHQAPEDWLQKIDSEPRWQAYFKRELLQRDVLDGSLSACIRIAGGGHWIQGSVPVLSFIQEGQQVLSERVIELFLLKVVRIRIPSGKYEGRLLQVPTLLEFFGSLEEGCPKETLDSMLFYWRLFKNNLQSFTDLSMEILDSFKDLPGYQLMYRLKKGFESNDPNFKAKKKDLNRKNYENTVKPNRKSIVGDPQAQAKKSDENRQSYLRKKAKSSTT